MENFQFQQTGSRSINVLKIYTRAAGRDDVVFSVYRESVLCAVRFIKRVCNIIKSSHGDIGCCFTFKKLNYSLGANRQL
jgi:hypothetical protein